MNNIFTSDDVLGSPETQFSEHAVLSWFSGKKAVEQARQALANLAECERAGYWLPGYSRRVTAALSKQAAASKASKS